MTGNATVAVPITRPCELWRTGSSASSTATSPTAAATTSMWPSASSAPNTKPPLAMFKGVGYLHAGTTMTAAARCF